jgi:hypothetical protein
MLMLLLLLQPPMTFHPSVDDNNNELTSMHEICFGQRALHCQRRRKFQRRAAARQEVAECKQLTNDESTANSSLKEKLVAVLRHIGRLNIDVSLSSTG